LKVKAGQYIGLLDDKLVVAADDARSAIVGLLDKAGAKKAERVTVYYGSDTTQHQARSMIESLVDQFNSPEFELVEGGQALYPYIMSVE
jgi:dihydroxyacetone kinase-like predicted kinase